MPEPSATHVHERRRALNETAYPRGVPRQRVDLLPDVILRWAGGGGRLGEEGR